MCVCVGGGGGGGGRGMILECFKKIIPKLDYVVTELFFFFL